MNGRDGPDRHAVFLINDFVDALVIKFVHSNLTGDRRNLEFTRRFVPVIRQQEMFDRKSRAHVFRCPGGTPDLERNRTTRSPATGPQRIQITPMISVQVTEKNLGEIFVGDHQRRDVAHRPRANIEDEFVAIA